MVDIKIRATSYKLCSFKLGSIVCQDSSEHVESINDVLQKLDRGFLSYVHHWHSFHPLGECVDCKESESSWCPGQNTHDVNSSYCKVSGEIDQPKRICMLCCLLLEELAIITLGDDLHRVILSCRPVETMSECLDYDKMP
jgi:hypothetical protein